MLQPGGTPVVQCQPQAPRTSHRACCKQAQTSGFAQPVSGCLRLPN